MYVNKEEYLEITQTPVVWLITEFTSVEEGLGAKNENLGTQKCLQFHLV